MIKEPEKNQINGLYNELSAFVRRGYFLNHDESFTKDLIKSLLINQARYGYRACPCRLASGIKTQDLDIICPCDYRDADLAKYGTCYCSLYVTKKIHDNKLAVKPIPERRLHKLSSISSEYRSAGKEESAIKEGLKNMENSKNSQPLKGLSFPVWRCQVCGYVCAHDQAPDTCPICGVSQEKFERFI